MVSIERARRDELRAAGDALAESHLDDPAMGVFFPDAATRPAALRTLFRATALDAGRAGTVDVAVDEGRVVGTAAWLPPGAFPPSGLRALRMAPAFLAMFATHRGSGRMLTAFSRRGSQEAPDEAYAFLMGLGVRPSDHGRGIGTVLLRAGLARADAEGLACFLYTAKERNVAWYERFGFAVRREPWRPWPGGPTHWGMWRAAKVSSRPRPPE